MKKNKMPQKSTQELQMTSYLSGGNAPYIEELYDAYLKNPDAVDLEWQQYFKELKGERAGTADISHEEIRSQFREMARHPIRPAAEAVTGANKQGNVDALITAYRRFGHLNANLNPLASDLVPDTRLQLAHHHLSDADPNDPFETRGLLDKSQASLQDILAALKATYCNTNFLIP